MKINKAFLNIPVLIISFLCVVLMIFMLLFGDIFSLGIKNGLLLCGNILIPALFPFMIISSFCSNEKILKVLSKPLKFLSKLFKIPQSCCSIYFLSLIGGYIAGPIAIANAKNDNIINKNTAEKLLCYCVNSGPAYIITFIGGFVFKNIFIGFAMFLCQIISSFIIGILIRNKDNTFKLIETKIKKQQSIGTSFTNAVSSSSIIMMQMCGFVLIFSAIVVFLQNLFGKSFVLNSFCGILEVTNSINNMQEYVYSFYNGGISTITAVMTCFITSFSGICVILQISSICQKENISLNLFIKTRVLYCLISSLLFFFTTKIFPQILVCDIPNSINVWIAQNGKTGEFFASTPLFTIIMICMCIFLILTFDKKKNKKEN